MSKIVVKLTSEGPGRLRKLRKCKIPKRINQTLSRAQSSFDRGFLSFLLVLW